MNAMVGFRTNSIGSLTPTPAERQVAQEKVWAMAKAALLGQVHEKAVSYASGLPTGVRTVSNELDRDTFLQLLVMQMQTQDPLEPMTNEDMIAQLAQFSALEQMTQLNTRFEQLSSALTGQSLVTASTLLGRTVSGTSVDGQSVAGVVERVYTDNGTVYVAVGGQIVELGNLTEVGTGS